MPVAHAEGAELFYEVTGDRAPACCSSTDRAPLSTTSALITAALLATVRGPGLRLPGVGPEQRGGRRLHHGDVCHRRRGGHGRRRLGDGAGGRASASGGWWPWSSWFPSRAGSIGWPSCARRPAVAVDRPSPCTSWRSLDSRARHARRLALLDSRFDRAWLDTHPARPHPGVGHGVPGPGSRSPPPGRVLRLQLQARRTHDTWDRLATIACPTFIGCGRYDGIAPTGQQPGHGVPDQRRRTPRLRGRPRLPGPGSRRVSTTLPPSSWPVRPRRPSGVGPVAGTGVRRVVDLGGRGHPAERGAEGPGRRPHGQPVAGRDRARCSWRRAQGGRTPWAANTRSP